MLRNFHENIGKHIRCPIPPITILAVFWAVVFPALLISLTLFQNLPLEPSSSKSLKNYFSFLIFFFLFYFSFPLNFFSALSLSLTRVNLYDIKNPTGGPTCNYIIKRFHGERIGSFWHIITMQSRHSILPQGLRL